MCERRVSKTCVIAGSHYHGGVEHHAVIIVLNKGELSVAVIISISLIQMIIRVLHIVEGDETADIVVCDVGSRDGIRGIVLAVSDDDDIIRVEVLNLRSAAVFREHRAFEVSPYRVANPQAAC